MNVGDLKPSAATLTYESGHVLHVEESDDGTLEIRFPKPRKPMRPAVILLIYGAVAAAATSRFGMHVAQNYGLTSLTWQVLFGWVFISTALGFLGLQLHSAVVQVIEEAYERPAAILLTRDRLFARTPNRGVVWEAPRDTVDDVYLVFGVALRIHEKKRDTGVFLNLFGLPAADRQRVRDVLRHALRIR